MAGDDQARAVAGAPDFRRLAALQQSGWRHYGLAALLLLVVAGLTGAVGGALLSAAPFPMALVGVLVASLAALCWREALERRDRAEGLLVLEEEWEALPVHDDGGRERLVALIEAMFGVRRGMPT